MQTPTFRFSLYRFVGPKGHRTTEIVKDLTLAHGMRTVVEGDENIIELCKRKVLEWANSKGIYVIPRDPYPSAKYPGKVWLEFRFGSFTL